MVRYDLNCVESAVKPQSTNEPSSDWVTYKVIHLLQAWFLYSCAPVDKISTATVCRESLCSSGASCETTLVQLIKCPLTWNLWSFGQFVFFAGFL